MVKQTLLLLFVFITMLCNAMEQSTSDDLFLSDSDEDISSEFSEELEEDDVIEKELDQNLTDDSDIDDAEDEEIVPILLGLGSFLGGLYAATAISCGALQDILPPKSDDDDSLRFMRDQIPHRYRVTNARCSRTTTGLQQCRMVDQGDFHIIGHRGDPINHCENTMPAFESALQKGANAIELDVSQLKDGSVVLWHDWFNHKPPLSGGKYKTLNMINFVRRHGMEPDMKCRPNLNGCDGDIDKYTPEEFYKHCYYEYNNTPAYDPKFISGLGSAGEKFKEYLKKFGFTLPGEGANTGYAPPGSPRRVVTWKAFLKKFGQDDRLRYIYVDFKMPGSYSMSKASRFAKKILDDCKPYGNAIWPKLVFMSPFRSIAKAIKSTLASYSLFAPGELGGAGVSYDREINEPWCFSWKDGRHGKHKVIPAALSLKTNYASFGRPSSATEFINCCQYKKWRATMRLDMGDKFKANRSRKEWNRMKLIVWTLNDPGEQMEMINYAADGMVTDRVELLAPRFKGYFGSNGCKKGLLRVGSTCTNQCPIEQGFEEPSSKAGWCTVCPSSEYGVGKFTRLNGKCVDKCPDDMIAFKKKGNYWEYKGNWKDRAPGRTWYDCHVPPETLNPRKDTYWNGGWIFGDPNPLRPPTTCPRGYKYYGTRWSFDADKKRFHRASATRLCYYYKKQCPSGKERGIEGIFCVDPCPAGHERSKWHNVCLLKCNTKQRRSKYNDECVDRCNTDSNWVVGDQCVAKSENPCADGWTPTPRSGNVVSESDIKDVFQCWPSYMVDSTEKPPIRTYLKPTTCTNSWPKCTPPYTFARCRFYKCTPWSKNVCCDKCKWHGGGLCQKPHKDTDGRKKLH